MSRDFVVGAVTTLLILTLLTVLTAPFTAPELLGVLGVYLLVKAIDYALRRP